MKILIKALLVLSLIYSGKRKNEPKGYAIIISVPQVNNRLLQKTYHLSDTINFAMLPGTIKDGERVNKILLQEGFKSENILRIGVKSTDNVKIEDILMAFKNLAGVVKENDLFVFYYSGHGHQVEDQPDGDENDHLDEVLVANNGFLVDDKINDIYKKYFGKTRNVMLVDACHAGSVQRINYIFLNENISKKTKRYSADCNIGAETNVDETINMIYYGASHDENNGYDTGDGGFFTKAINILYNPRYWRNIKPLDLACKVSTQMKAMGDPGKGLIQYSELGKLSDDFRNSYLFKIK